MEAMRQGFIQLAPRWAGLAGAFVVESLDQQFAAINYNFIISGDAVYI